MKRTMMGAAAALVALAALVGMAGPAEASSVSHGPYSATATEPFAPMEGECVYIFVTVTSTDPPLVGELAYTVVDAVAPGGVWVDGDLFDAGATGSVAVCGGVRPLPEVLALEVVHPNGPDVTFTVPVVFTPRPVAPVVPTPTPAVSTPPPALPSWPDLNPPQRCASHREARSLRTWMRPRDVSRMLGVSAYLTVDNARWYDGCGDRNLRVTFRGGRVVKGKWM